MAFSVIIDDGVYSRLNDDLKVKYESDAVSFFKKNEYSEKYFINKYKEKNPVEFTLFGYLLDSGLISVRRHSKNTTKQQKCIEKKISIMMVGGHLEYLIGLYYLNYLNKDNRILGYKYLCTALAKGKKEAAASLNEEFYCYSREIMEFITDENNIDIVFPVIDEIELVTEQFRQNVKNIKINLEQKKQYKEYYLDYVLDENLPPTIPSDVKKLVKDFV